MSVSNQDDDGMFAFTNPTTGQESIKERALITARGIAALAKTFGKGAA